MNSYKYNRSGLIYIKPKNIQKKYDYAGFDKYDPLIDDLMYTMFGKKYWELPNDNSKTSNVSENHKGGENIMGTALRRSLGYKVKPVNGDSFIRELSNNAKKLKAIVVKDQNGNIVKVFDLGQYTVSEEAVYEYKYTSKKDKTTKTSYKLASEINEYLFDDKGHGFDKPQ